jgi:hypothetical protein
MSVLPSDIVVYGAANMPEADGIAAGGAVDFSRRVAFYDIAPAGKVDVISSSASDTATKITYYGRDPAGVIQSETLTLNGQAWVAGSHELERLLFAALSGATPNGPVADPEGTAAVGDIALAANSCVLPAASITTDETSHTARTGSANHSGTTPALFKLQSGDGSNVSPGQIIWTKGGTGANQLRQIITTSGYGTDIVAVSRDWDTIPDNTTTYKILQGMLFEISPNPVTAVIRLFSTSAADAPTGAQRLYYEKVFVVNNNTSTALTGAQIEVAGETPGLPAGASLKLALATALNDIGSVADRQTMPPSGLGSFTAQPAFLSIPGAGNLPSGPVPNASGAQGVWLQLTLPAGTAPYKGSVDLRIQGTTT